MSFFRKKAHQKRVVVRKGPSVLFSLRPFICLALAPRGSSILWLKNGCFAAYFSLLHSSGCFASLLIQSLILVLALFRLVKLRLTVFGWLGVPPPLSSLVNSGFVPHPSLTSSGELRRAARSFNHSF